MAGGHSDYNRGAMEINAQKGTFSGFMGGTVYGSSALILMLLMPILVFAVGLGWVPSLIATFVLGMLIGLGLKLKSGWYVGLIGSCIVLAVLILIFRLISGIFF